MNNYSLANDAGLIDFTFAALYHGYYNRSPYSKFVLSNDEITIEFDENTINLKLGKLVPNIGEWHVLSNTMFKWSQVPRVMTYDGVKRELSNKVNLTPKQKAVDDALGTDFGKSLASHAREKLVALMDDMRGDGNNLYYLKQYATTPYGFTFSVKTGLFRTTITLEIDSDSVLSKEESLEIVKNCFGDCFPILVVEL